MADIKFEIQEELGAISESTKGFLKMENDLCILSDYELEKFGFKSI